MISTPSDAEIWHMWMPMARMGVADPVEFARAVLAKWGTPQPVVRESSEDLYWELHGLSKILEGSGLIDESQHPDAYSTILEAMAFVRGQQSVVREPQCWCLTCRPMRIDEPSSIRMALCPTCGNKRCPKANDHRNRCSNSNVPGQKGSAYEGCGITQKGGQHG